MRTASRLALSGLVSVALVASCARSESQPKVSLRDFGSTPPVQQPAAVLSEPARAALARGNEDYRAARFGAALESYRAASRETPDNAAPWFGILMAAKKLGNLPLADSASARIRELSGEATPEGVHGSGVHDTLPSGRAGL